MATTISVNKQSVTELLSSGKAKPFLIPEYQRPYAWSEDEATTLFEDLWEFASIGTGEDKTYFLGSIVSYENTEKEQEIIDGQQRITSLFLLLRAIYTKLSSATTKTAEAQNFIQKIEQSIWKTDKFTGKVDFAEVLLTSRVVSNIGNEILKNILRTGATEQGAKDHYSLNYRVFQELFEKHSAENALMVYEFIYSLLNQAILLPISADSQDTALTIFSTLNNRGLPLADSDIFKAKIYNHLSTEEKEKFIQEWQELDDIAQNLDEDIQKLFYHYMFFLRAYEKDTDTTTPGLRKYYLDKNGSRLFSSVLMSDLKLSLNLWKVVNKHEVIEDEPWTKNRKICQVLDILKSYTNEFWKYPVVIYYLTHRNNDAFEVEFLQFLKKLTVLILSKYLEMPAVSAVKGDILKLNLEITQSSTPKFEFQDTDFPSRATKIRTPHRNTVRMLLKILAYEEQDDILPYKWEIEHIFPQKWQTNHFPDASEKSIKEKIEHLGNKIPFEKKLNISAGNGYFIKKQKDYKQSNIEITKKFGYSDISDWTLDDITERDVRVSDSIENVLLKWSADYTNTHQNL